MKNNEIKISSNKSFGIVFAIVFFLIALWPIIKSDDIRIWSLIVSIIFLILGIMNSSILTPLNKIWFRFGIFLGNFIAPVVMGIIFFFVVTPIGLIMRLLGRDLIKLKKNNENSYWIEKKDTESSMRKQF